MRLYRPFVFLRLLYPGAVFRIRTRNKELCLTFDDGPDPESTPGILEILEDHDIKATFFCSGQESEKYPELTALIASKGHIIGNHGYRHLNGWKTGLNDYIENVYRAANITSRDLFRPPYGRISPLQYRKLIGRFTIVFWDLMPYDFDMRTNTEKILNVLMKKIRPGSIIVLHDKSFKSFHFLAEFIKYAGDRGYKFVPFPVSYNK
jgi:peptidoglycan/xylan/chitin deacetylase (PgdA/CDA1 family)